MSCVRTDRIVLDLHVHPTIGRLGIAAVTRTDLKRLVETLDEKVRSGALSWKTATNVWMTVRALFRDAQGAKRVDLCVRDDNPADGVAGPDEGAKKAKQYLYLSEFLTLVSCDRVPIRWRRLFALAAYTYTRPGELAALEWGDVDLEHGTIHVHKSIDRVRKSDVGSTKTETARRVPIEPELLPLLRVLRDRAGGKGAVCSMPSPGMLSRKLRLYLERAGVTRPELLVPTPTSKAMTFYDLRATGITWCAVRGDVPWLTSITNSAQRQLHFPIDLVHRLLARLGRGNCRGCLPLGLVGGVGSDAGAGHLDDDGVVHQAVDRRGCPRVRLKS